eukprot:108555_1
MSIIEKDIEPNDNESGNQSSDLKPPESQPHCNGVTVSEATPTVANGTVHTTSAPSDSLPPPQPTSNPFPEPSISTEAIEVIEAIEATATVTNITKKVTGKKRKRETTRWGPPPRKKRWGTASKSVKSTSLITNLLKFSQNTNPNQSSSSSSLTSAFSKAWNENQTKIFLLKNQLQDISTRLIAPGAFVAAQSDQERSPSPEPIYDQKGVRINTREYRLREKLQQQRIKIIQQIIELDGNYQPPPDYKPPKLTHKIMMPVDDYPDYNFFGLIVGPRGNTQKEMQKETGCKIAVRGQGACLDKPGRMIHPDDNEPLHVHITAPNQESMDKAIGMIEKLFNDVKTGGGEHKAKQLRELATINGTLRIESRCRICGGQHPIYRCPEKTGEKWTPADVQCKICGELTHVTEDCKHYKKGKNIQQIIQNRPSIDAEYSAFMQELIGDGPMSSNRPIAAITAPTQRTNGVKAVSDEKKKGDGTVTLSNGYHNVPPPTQSGAQAPTQYVNGEDGKEEMKNGIAPNAQTQMLAAGMHMNMGMLGAPMYPMGMPMMTPNVYGMGMMAPNGMYGMRPAYPMPINPYMPRPPMHPFPMNPYMSYGGVPPPPPPPANNGQ